MSDRARRKRLVKASAWVLWLFGTLLAVEASRQGRRRQERGAVRVRVIEATRLREPGGCGDDWRRQTASDLPAGRLVEGRVTDQQTGESFQHVALHAGEIVVAESDDGYRRTVASAYRQQADMVRFLTPSTFPVEDPRGQPMALVAWLQRKEPMCRSRVCWCQWESQRFAVRRVVRNHAPRLVLTKSRNNDEPSVILKRMEILFILFMLL